MGVYNHKETPIGRIPEDWDVVRLGDVAEVVSGFAFPLEYQGKNSGEYPFVKVNDLNSAQKYITKAENFIDDLKALRAKVYPPNTIIFPKIGMALYLNKFRILKIWGTFDNNVAGVIPKKHEPEFLYYYFLGKVDLRQLSNQTTAPSIRKSTLEALIVPLPPLPEQRKIAEILSTVDKAIEKVNEAIAKTERLKKGLMQELLTKGIGHEEFKDTEIGRIPKEWVIKELNEVTVEITIGVVSSATPYYTSPENGVPYFRSQNVRENKLTPTEIYVTKEFNEKHSRSILREGDVLTVQTGDIGTSCVVPKEFEGSNCHSLLITRTNNKILNPYFLLYSPKKFDFKYPQTTDGLR